MRVSVGLPFYNAEDTLGHAVRSVFMQTYADWELILVDDGSTDGSLAVARSAAQADPRVRVYHDGRHTNLSTRLNEIAQLARGLYLARMDADDMMHPRRLELQVRYMDENPAVDLLGTAVYAVGADDRVRGCVRYGAGGNPLAAILNHRLIMHPTILGRLEWFRKHPYDEHLVRNQAEELWCRTYRDTHFDNLPLPLMFYRSASLSDHRSRLYRVSAANERRLCRRYAAALGQARVAGFLLKSHAKELLHGLLALFHIPSVHQDLILSVRSERPNASSHDEAQELIDRIKRASL